MKKHNISKILFASSVLYAVSMSIGCLADGMSASTNSVNSINDDSVKIANTRYVKAKEDLAQAKKVLFWAKANLKAAQAEYKAAESNQTATVLDNNARRIASNINIPEEMKSSKIAATSNQAVPMVTNAPTTTSAAATTAETTSPSMNSTKINVNNMNSSFLDNTTVAPVAATTTTTTNSSNYSSMGNLGAPSTTNSTSQAKSAFQAPLP